MAFHGGYTQSLALRLYREFYRDDPVAPLAAEGLALEILAEAFRRQGAVTQRIPPRWVKRVKEVLHDRFNEQLTLFEIARSASIHPTHLARAFRRHFGCPVGEYVRQRRVEFVCDQLTNTSLPLAEIALAAGFSDQSHFNRIFKRCMAMTPSQFRRSSRSG